MRVSRRQRKKNRGYIVGIMFIVLLIVVVVSTAVFYYVSQEPPLNKMTLCPQKGADGHILFLVDKTDPLSFTQKESFKVLLQRVLTEEVPPGYLFSIFVLGEDYVNSAKPVLELCNPGDGRDRNIWTSNIDRLRKQYEIKFHDPILQISEDLLITTPAKSSPIMEQIQLASINGFRRKSVKGPHRLIIVSDMLQNTPEYSMYSSGYNYESFRETFYARKLAPDLQGAEVELHYILNAAKRQTRRHLKFWEEYFSDAGAKIVLVHTLEG